MFNHISVFTFMFPETKAHRLHSYILHPTAQLFTKDTILPNHYKEYCTNHYKNCATLRFTNCLRTESLQKNVTLRFTLKTDHTSSELHTIKNKPHSGTMKHPLSQKPNQNKS
jgi:hypothetical protein